MRSTFALACVATMAAANTEVPEKAVPFQPRISKPADYKTCELCLVNDLYWCKTESDSGDPEFECQDIKPVKNPDCPKIDGRVDDNCKYTYTCADGTTPAIRAFSFCTIEAVADFPCPADKIITDDDKGPEIESESTFYTGAYDPKTNVLLQPDIMHKLSPN